MRSGGIFHRKADTVIVKEVKSTYGAVPIKPTDIVLDLGANIGASARLFLDKGAAKVIAIEPDPTNVILAKRNLARRSALVIWAAVGPVAGRTTVYARPDKPYLTSNLDDKGRMAIKVPMVTLGGLLAQFGPSIVKCDIEFGEYSLPELDSLPGKVRVLAMEVHVRYDLVFASRTQTEQELRLQRQEAARLMASIEAQGFKRIQSKVKLAKTGPIEDDTGLDPLIKSVDAIWVR